MSFSTKLLEKGIARRKVNTEKYPTNSLKLQWIRVEKSSPYQIKYKETLQEMVSFDVLDLTPSTRRGRVPSFAGIQQENCTKRTVNPKKKQDMMDLLAFIPPVYQGYFVDLTTDNQIQQASGPLSLTMKIQKLNKKLLNIRSNFSFYELNI